MSKEIPSSRLVSTQVAYLYAEIYKVTQACSVPDASSYLVNNQTPKMRLCEEYIYELIGNVLPHVTTITPAARTTIADDAISLFYKRMLENPEATSDLCGPKRVADPNEPEKIPFSVLDAEVSERMMFERQLYIGLFDKLQFYKYKINNNTATYDEQELFSEINERIESLENEFYQFYEEPITAASFVKQRTLHYLFRSIPTKRQNNEDAPPSSKNNDTLYQKRLQRVLTGVNISSPFSNFIRYEFDRAFTTGIDHMKATMDHSSIFYYLAPDDGSLKYPFFEISDKKTRWAMEVKVFHLAQKRLAEVRNLRAQFSSSPEHSANLKEEERRLEIIVKEWNKVLSTRPKNSSH